MLRIDYSAHRKAFLMRLGGNSYKRIAWSMKCSEETARRLVRLEHRRYRLAIEAEFS